MKEITLYNVQDMTAMAEAIAKSGLFGMKNRDQALALMLVAQSEGEHPATITQDYDIIQGRACRKSHSLLARFQAMGGKVEWHTLDRELAEATFSHPAGGKLKVSWTIEQAKHAGLAGKDNWKKYPQAMLRARCISEGIRAVYPAAIGGMLIAEEAQDMPRQELNMGDAEIVPESASTHDKVRAKVEALAQPELPPIEAEPVPLDDEQMDLVGRTAYEELMFKLANCETPMEFGPLLDESKAIYLDLDKAQKTAMTKAINALKEEFGHVDTNA